MALIYPSDWKFALDDEAEPIQPALLQVLRQQVIKIANGAPNKKDVVEAFKEEFASIAGESSSWSSSYDWAVNDLSSAMDAAAKNAATFIDAYWSALKSVERQGVQCPKLETINKLLTINGCPFEIRPPNLVKRGADAVVVKEVDAKAAKTDQFFRYELGDVLGAGGFGTVYRATRKTSAGSFEFALKVLDPSPFVHDKEKAIKRFLREIRALLSLQHRGIVPYFDAGVDTTGRPYVVMPLIAGRNIRDASEGLSHRARCSLLAEVLLAIHYAHENDVLHRDLKPSNILVRAADAQPIVVDFGSAYLLEQMDSKSLTTAAVGSVGYIPSEVLADPSKRSTQHDIYSCGVIAYELFARHRPDPSAYRPLSASFAELGALDEAIQKALAPEHSRYASAEDFRLGIVEVERGL
jgi:hypothetical protein